jgi:hypothetical protein
MRALALVLVGMISLSGPVDTRAGRWAAWDTAAFDVRPLGVDITIAASVLSFFFGAYAVQRARRIRLAQLRNS